MDWLQILAGGAAGLGQGLGQVNDLRQQQFQNQLRQREQDMLMKERQRQAVTEAYQMIDGGGQLTPELAKSAKEIGLPVYAGEGGTFIRPKSKQQELIEAQLKDRELELAEKQDLQRRRDEFDALTPEQLKAMDPFTREILASKAGYDKMDVLTPDEKIKFSEKIAVANAAGSARVLAASMPRPVNPEVMALNKAKFEASMRARAGQLARTGMGAYMPPDQIAALEEQIFQTLMQQGAEAPAPTGAVPSMGNRKQFGKYTVEY